METNVVNKPSTYGWHEVPGEGSIRNAFTLAEVLITLAIIGVVAAMTIPTLISDFQEKVTVTKLQKVYSMAKIQVLQLQN